MDALALLTADHNRVRALFSRFQKAKDQGNNELIGALADKIAEELEVHTAIEEEVFYPSVRKLDGELSELLGESLQEHHVVKVLLDELAGVPAGGEEWTAKMSVIIENVEHHADEEEKELFPKVRRAADTEQLAALGDELDTKKGELGAPTMADREGLSADQVHELASEQEIPGRSTMRLEELRATIDPG